MFGLFFIFRQFLAGFFFPLKSLPWRDFFFPRKSLPSVTHSIEKRVFFSGNQKKTVLSITDPIFAENSQKINYSLEKKMVPMNKVEKSLVAK